MSSSRAFSASNSGSILFTYKFLLNSSRLISHSFRIRFNRPRPICWCIGTTVYLPSGCLIETWEPLCLIGTNPNLERTLQTSFPDKTGNLFILTPCLSAVHFIFLPLLAVCQRTLHWIHLFVFQGRVLWPLSH